jgi:hypothetical protein
MDYPIIRIGDIRQSLKPLARTASANGSGVDLLGYDGAMIVVDAGTVTDGTHTVSLEESADNSTFTAVAAGNLEGTLPALITTNDDQIHTAEYRGTKRYVRGVITVTGSPSTGAVVGIAVIRGNPKY